MTRNTSEVEQAVSRTLRENLEKLQRTAEELNQSLNDLVSACASARSSNALSPMLRAQTAAASLAASLDVLSRFVTGALQQAPRSPAAQEPFAVPMREAASSAVLDPPALPHPERDAGEKTAVEQPAVEETVDEQPPADIHEPPPAAAAADELPRTVPEFSGMDSPAVSAASISIEEMPLVSPGFDVSALSPEAQELHRRANRVAKVSMQDIKMLRPHEVGLGKEHKDLCLRLRDDIERAHKEYDRRFHAILDHPVDYFYDWMVEILADGNAETLGEYPYPSPVLRR
jgi:hypothetical protein